VKRVFIEGTEFQSVAPSPGRIPAPTYPRVPASFPQLGFDISTMGLALAMALAMRGVLFNLPSVLSSLLHNVELNAPLVATVGGIASVSRRPPAPS
jgi:protein N-lysine methyltransferase METTL21C